MTQIIQGNYFSSNRVGEYYLLEFYRTHSQVQERRKSFPKELKNRFPNKTKFPYKRILTELKLVENINLCNEENQIKYFKQQIKELKQKNRLNKADLDMLQYLTKRKIEAMSDYNIEKGFLPLSIDIPIMYCLTFVKDRIKQNYIEEQWFKNNRNRIHKVIETNSYPELLEKIESEYGNTHLTTVMKGLVHFSFFEYIPNKYISNKISELEVELYRPKKFKPYSSSLTPEQIKFVEKQVKEMYPSKN